MTKSRTSPKSEGPAGTTPQLARAWGPKGPKGPRPKPETTQAINVPSRTQQTYTAAPETHSILRSPRCLVRGRWDELFPTLEGLNTALDPVNPPLPCSSQQAWGVHPAASGKVQVQAQGDDEDKDEDAKEKTNKTRQAEAARGASKIRVDGRKDPTLTTLEVKRTQWTQEKEEERSVLPCRGDGNGSIITLTSGREKESASLKNAGGQEREGERGRERGERKGEREATCGIRWGTTVRGISFKLSNAVGITSAPYFWMESFSSSRLPRFIVL